MATLDSELNLSIVDSFNPRHISDTSETLLDVAINMSLLAELFAPHVTLAINRGSTRCHKGIVMRTPVHLVLQL